MFELPNLHLHVKIVRLTIPCQSTDKIKPRSRFVLTRGSKKILLVDWSRARRAVTRSTFKPSRTRDAKQLNSFLRSKNCWRILRVRTGTLQLPRLFPRSETVSDGDLERSAGGLPQLVRTLP